MSNVQTARSKRLTLLRTSILGAGATVLRIATGFVLNKVIAVYVGPSGLALIGQFQNFSGMAATVAAAGLNTGLTKYTAELQDDPVALSRIWNGALRITLAMTTATALACALGSEHLSVLLLGTPEYASIFLLFAVSLLFQTMSGLALSILNGQKRINLYIGLSVANNLTTFLLVALLTAAKELHGALLASAAAPILGAIITFAYVRKEGWSASFFSHKADTRSAARLLAFSAMAIISVLSLGFAQIAIRNHLAGQFGWAAAGHWQAVVKISDYYLMLITSSLSIYYLPRLAEIRQQSEMRAEILQTYKLVVPLASMGALAIYLARNWIATTLFSNEFEPMVDLMPFQLIGDVLKICAWVLGYIMWARAMAMTFVLSELGFAALYVGLVFAGTAVMGLAGSTAAFAWTYAVYLVAMIVLFRRHLRRQ